MIQPRNIIVRKTETETVQIGNPYDNIHRYYDQNMEMTIVKLRTGEMYATRELKEMIVAILGSSVAVCIHDEEVNLGGLCQIILPDNNPSKFGSAVMRKFLNKLIKNGAEKTKLQAKIFGGVTSYSNIKNNNVAFVREFLASENIKVISEDTGGAFPRRIHYFPDTGKALVRKLKRKEDLFIFDKEKDYKENYFVNGYNL